MAPGRPFTTPPDSPHRAEIIRYMRTSEAIHGDPAVERKPVFEDGKPVYDGENVRTVSVESVRYKNTPSRFKEPEKRPDSGIKAPKRRK